MLHPTPEKRPTLEELSKTLNKKLEGTYDINASFEDKYALDLDELK